MEKYIYKLFIGALCLCSLPAGAWHGDVKVETPKMQLLLTAAEGGDVRLVYFGAKTATRQEIVDAGADLNFSALPAFGTVDMIHLPAIQVQHANGDQNLELEVTDYASTDEGAAVVHTFTMKDKLLPFTVCLCYKAYKNVDVMETWTEVNHEEKRAVILKRYDSGHLSIRRNDVWLTHLHGDWAAESDVTQEPLTRPEGDSQQRRCPKLAS